MAEKLQCGMRLYDKKTRSEMTCTLERGHEKPVHEQFLNGKWLGGWVDHGEPVYKNMKKKSDWVQKPPLDMPDPPKDDAASKQVSLQPESVE